MKKWNSPVLTNLSIYQTKSCMMPFGIYYYCCGERFETMEELDAHMQADPDADHCAGIGES